ncbi:hypothetical protein B0H12DRAFT_672579 [Mycena haematopus]|nr:hypothetical protein B0H12DRAFT_672579 [Mycena haematopus]
MAISWLRVRQFARKMLSTLRKLVQKLLETQFYVQRTGYQPLKSHMSLFLPLRQRRDLRTGPSSWCQIRAAVFTPGLRRALDERGNLFDLGDVLHLTGSHRRYAKTGSPMHSSAWALVLTSLSWIRRWISRFRENRTVYGVGGVTIS